MRKILLTGASGQLGWELQRTLQTLGHVVAPDSAEFNLAKPDQLTSYIRRLKPDLIVNPAAYTAVDKAESEPALAHAINAEAPAVLAREAARMGISLVHFSTDYVFDGSKQTAYQENDAPNPLGVYGASKLSGEQAVQASDTEHLILRTSWVYGLRGRNFLLTMQRLARERAELAVVNDQIGAPTWSRSIAEASAQILALWLSPGTTHENRQQLSGVYHLSCTGKTSWHGFAYAILENLRRNEDGIASLKAITTRAYPAPARRPQNSMLSNEKLRRVFGVQLPDWESALSLCLGES